MSYFRRRAALVLACALSFASAARAEFVVGATQAKGKEARELAREFEKAGFLSTLVDSLNETIDVPERLEVRLAECGEANAYYDSSNAQILMCLELVASYYEALAAQYEAGDALDGAVINAFLFVFFHEVGHALVDVLELPITGREEDAVDQLSAWVLIDNDEGDQAVLDGALSFYVYGDATDEESSFADEHSFNKQRYYNMVCWVYGSDPAKYAHLVGETEDDWLPQARADQCEAEYAQLDRAWSTLLAEHLVEDEAAPEDEDADEGERVLGRATPYRSK